MVDPDAARTVVLVFIFHLACGRAGRQPLGSIMEPVPARTVVVACMGIPRSTRAAPRVDGGPAAGLDARARLHRSPRVWSAGSQPKGSIRGPVPARTVAVVFISASSAPRVDAGAVARANAGARRHRCLRVMRLPAVSRCRWGPSRRRRRRVHGCSCSSSGLLNPWGRCTGRCRPGSSCSCSSCTSRVGFPPVSPWGRCRRRRRRGCSSSSASRSPRQWFQPFGSMPLPCAARTAVVVRIPASLAARSAVGVPSPAAAGADVCARGHRDLSRWGRRSRCSRHGRSSPMSSRALRSAVRVDAGRVARADAGGRAHLDLLVQPFGSTQAE